MEGDPVPFIAARFMQAAPVYSIRRCSMKRFRYFLILVLGTFLLAGGGYLWMMRGAADGRYCVNCHEIAASREAWSSSAHRNMACTSCHGTAFSEGWHSLKEKSAMALRHYSRRPQENIQMTDAQVAEIMNRCRQCHQQQYADWISSGHSLTYADVFLNPEHNRTEQPNSDCLRCHGMFFSGTTAEIVTPLDTRGPWQMKHEELRTRRAIPCSSCHHIHSPGLPAVSPDYARPGAIAQSRLVQPTTTGFYDRREKTFYFMSDLPVPRIAQSGLSLPVAPDVRLRNCYQCHAPDAYHEAGTSDDRTPRGVHQGFSCLACHNTHSLDARASCGLCHPQVSNCGLDVTRMDTTFRSPASPHNIHFVGCADCHPQGVPVSPKARKKPAPGRI